MPPHTTVVFLVFPEELTSCFLRLKKNLIKEFFFPDSSFLEYNYFVFEWNELLSSFYLFIFSLAIRVLLNLKT